MTAWPSIQVELAQDMTVWEGRQKCQIERRCRPFRLRATAVSLLPAGARPISKISAKPVEYWAAIRSRPCASSMAALSVVVGGCRTSWCALWPRPPGFASRMAAKACSASSIVRSSQNPLQSLAKVRSARRQARPEPGEPRADDAKIGVAGNDRAGSVMRIENALADAEPGRRHRRCAGLGAHLEVRHCHS